MTDEMQKVFDDASAPFLEPGGAISLADTRKMAWRYFLEINSVCNLHCPTCTKGNQAGYEHQTGLMDFDLMEKILDKIKGENPDAIVFTYGNSEPFLHPRLPECISAIKSRGLNAQLSTNLNRVNRLDELLSARPDMIIISLSGFTQDVYVKGHAGGNIERVKENIKLIAEANARQPSKINICVNYHVYNDNGHEAPLMKAYAEGLGLGFFTSIARAISMENAIQYNRSLDPEAVPFEVQPDRPDWNKELPPIGQTYVDTMKRLIIPPTVAKDMYKGFHTPAACPIGRMFCFIRHDGKTELCACVADRRITVGDFLETTQEQMIEQRTNHAICQQCSKYKLRFYFHIVDRAKWVPNV